MNPGFGPLMEVPVCRMQGDRKINTMSAELHPEDSGRLGQRRTQTPDLGQGDSGPKVIRREM